MSDEVILSEELTVDVDSVSYEGWFVVHRHEAGRASYVVSYRDLDEENHRFKAHQVDLMRVDARIGLAGLVQQYLQQRRGG